MTMSAVQAADERAQLAASVEPLVESVPEAAVCLFRSLGDPARLAILRHLGLGEHRVVDLTAHLGLAQSTVSAHLACLRDCGLVGFRAVGRASVYSLAVPDELMGLLAAAERLLGVTGDAVTLCTMVDHTGEAHAARPVDVASADRSSGPGRAG